MLKKDFTTKEDLMTILKILNDSNIKYWLDGGWGVDVLAGKQSRNHRDIDINFDAQYTQEILSLLKDHG
ncbi:MAG: nucleotidyltransferase domain-containing protein, partial [Clostridioides difficile]